ncbi:NAD(P)/FAD-dependent oxidoreductase [Marinomonas rhizomae]|uniref:Thioredoxin reductase n=1 Tax=Marinomonas rhizomae TaxID=491948 RepID=A0A366JBY4_9GAMM|nr:NAD(P)/FAD-dependent oxidoreductase [Marinomonas rhizomae]RBP83775.1 thioredoxin reductase [Marinomonas rhizomae]RNF73512.1 NAD(P)/FAD-dependent oxidoreductase [Marinomonas rhizomae]
MQLDVIVIGGSFAGLSAAMQLARGQRKVTVIDAGEPRNRFSDQSHGFFGLDGVSPFAIQQEAHRQLLKYPTVNIVKDKAENVEKSASGFHVMLGDGANLDSKKLILATGLRDELPTIPGLKERWGATVIHCPYCHGYEVRNQPLGVIATSPLSIHQAGMIPDWGPTTYFTQGLYEPDEVQRAFLLKRGVTIESTPVLEVLGRAPDISTVYLADGRTIRIAALFVGPRTHMASPFAKQLGCEFEDGPLGLVIKTDAVKQTSVEGVFAAGDISNPMQNATFASASGVMAGIGAHQSLMQD